MVNEKRVLLGDFISDIIIEQIASQFAEMISNGIINKNHSNDETKKIFKLSLQNLPVDEDKITYECIDVFTDKKRSKNDINNKKRENIICSIINKDIPDKYYKDSSEWYNLKNQTELFINKLCEENYITSINDVKCTIKGGRTNHYDFKININNEKDFMVEFKFNSSCVNNTPQFVSPMKPSQYLDGSYEDHYYDGYFRELSKLYKLPLPTKEQYLKCIHSPKPSYLKDYQEKYYRGCVKSSKYSGKENDVDFYETSKKISRTSIVDFILKYNLKNDKLTEYLLETQKNKYYMLYKDGHIHMETIKIDDFIITETIKEPEKNRYIAKTRSGKNLKILLRWKNGNGIAFPSFQIS